MKFLTEKPSNKAGFTLVEMLVGFGLLSVLLVLMTGIFTAALDAQLRSQATSSRQEDAQYILSRLSYDFNNATTMTTPASVGQQGSTLVLTINGQAWTYALSNGDLVLTNPQGSFILNSYLTTISQFSVTKVGNTTGKAAGRIQLSVGSRIQSASANDTVSYSTTFGVW
jgi:type II secretory pathway pseudopilin PulG